MKPWVFDLDGTLIDTQEAVRKAYEAVGVKMPDWAWGLPARQWLAQVCDSTDVDALHRAKNAVYPEMLKRWAKPLPLLEEARRAYAPVITGASAAAVVAVDKVFPGLRIVLWGATIDDKIQWLDFRFQEPGIYVDDNVYARAQVTRRTRWEATSPAGAVLALKMMETT